MKLVDILARDLKEWPAEVELMQKDMGGIWEVMPSGALGRKVASLELAEDWGGSSVNHAQWQAAVDALEAVATSNHCPKCERRSRPAIAEGGRCGDLVVRNGVWIKEDWTGEGLPPVGAVCEFKSTQHDGPREFEPVEIMYTSKVTVVAKRLDISRGMEEELLCHPGTAKFRPIPTPEQIAAEEIQRIRDEIGYQRPQLGVCPVEAMYNLGYRKIEIVEG